MIDDDDKDLNLHIAKMLEHMEANETAASPAPVHPIVIQPLEFLASRRKIAGVSSRTVLELLENAERLEHALRNIAIQTDDGSQAREICDRVLAGIFFP